MLVVKAIFCEKQYDSLRPLHNFCQPIKPRLWLVFLGHQKTTLFEAIGKESDRGPTLRVFSFRLFLNLVSEVLVNNYVYNFFFVVLDEYCIVAVFINCCSVDPSCSLDIAECTSNYLVSSCV